MLIADLESSVLAAHASPQGNFGLLSLSSLPDILEALSIVRELAKLNEIKESFATTEGVQVRLQVVLATARRAVKLTDSTGDDAALESFAKYVELPEAAEAIAANVALVEAVRKVA